jgi:hypothetical protein
MIMRVLTQLRQKWAYCQVCMGQTIQDELMALRRAWKCESCNHLLNDNGEPIAD